MMRRYSVPTAMTPSSLLKTLISGPGSRWQAIANTTMRATAIHAASLNVSLTRWPRRAPKFWPATGATENASATTGMNPAWMMRMPMPNPACAAAQAGFGIGIRIIQAGFMPVVALAFSVAPVAGQNFGARLGQRVKDTFKDAAWMAVALMVVFAIACHLLPGPLISVFSKDEGVIAVGTEYLRIISFNYVASGLVFVDSGWNHLKNPVERSKSIGASPRFTMFLGTAEVAGSIGVALGVLTQLAAIGLILIMLGAIQKKVFVWKIGFWGGRAYGWPYDLMLVVMNLVLITTGGGKFVLL